MEGVAFTVRAPPFSALRQRAAPGRDRSVLSAPRGWSARSARSAMRPPVRPLRASPGLAGLAALACGVLLLVSTLLVATSWSTAVPVPAPQTRPARKLRADTAAFAVPAALTVESAETIRALRLRDITVEALSCVLDGALGLEGSCLTARLTRSPLLFLSRRWKPRIFRLHSLLTPEECDALVAQGRPALEASTVVDGASGEGAISTVRTSTGARRRVAGLERGSRGPHRSRSLARRKRLARARRHLVAAAHPPAAAPGTFLTEGTPTTKVLRQRIAHLTSACVRVDGTGGTSLDPHSPRPALARTARARAQCCRRRTRRPSACCAVRRCAWLRRTHSGAEPPPPAPAFPRRRPAGSVLPPPPGLVCGPAQHQPGRPAGGDGTDVPDRR